MGADQYPPVLPTGFVWPAQRGTPWGYDSGNGPGTVAAGATTDLIPVQTMTVPDLGRPQTLAVINAGTMVQVAGNAAGFLYLYLDGTAVASKRWHTQGSAGFAQLIIPEWIALLTPGAHTIRLTGSAEALAALYSYAYGIAHFLG